MLKLFSVREAAELLGLHVRTVQTFLAGGRIRGVRISDHWRVPAEEIERIAREGVPRPERTR